MHDTTADSASQLVIRRRLSAPPARIFEAWTNPEEMRHWMGPEDNSVTDIAGDVREGGAYHITMQRSGSEPMTVRGTYRVVRPPEFISYTWRWDHDPEQTETLVSVEFKPLGDGTELVLTHERLASDESRENHSHGWNRSLDKLGPYLGDKS